MSTQALQTVPIAQITVRDQVRTSFDEESIRSLAATMAECGLQTPITVERSGGGFTLRHGERRLRAAKLLGWTTITAVVEDSALAEADTAQRQLIENAHREGLNPIDSAVAIKRLIHASGCNASEAARKLGFSNATVSRLLRLLDLPESVQQQVKTGAISPSAAYELAQAGSDVERQVLAARLVSGEITRDGVQRAVRTSQSPAAQDETAKAARSVTLRLAEDQTLTIRSASLSVDTLIQLTERVLSRARAARTKGHTLATLAQSLADECRPSAKSAST